MAHIPRKRFGQNFLVDKNYIDRLLVSINPGSDECFVEIGPGQAAITMPLLQAVQSLSVIEIDRDLVSLLKDKFSNESRLTIHNIDALKFDFSQLSPGIRLVGNLPYNISTPLIFHILHSKLVFGDMHFMLQKEVIDRMAADPGTKAYGKLSVMVQMLCHIEPLFVVPPQAFYPPPKVMSQIVRLSPKIQKLDFDLLRLEQVVSVAFGQRRKMLRQSLKSILTCDQLESVGVEPTLRAESLTLEQFAKLSLL